MEPKEREPVTPRVELHFVLGWPGRAIRVVIIINLDFMEGKKRHSREAANTEDEDEDAPLPDSSCVSLYRLNDRVLWNEVFRYPDSTEGAGEIVLGLADFVPEIAARRIGRQALESAPVIVSFHQLNDQFRRTAKRPLVLDNAKTQPQPQRTGRKRVRFNWDLPEEESNEEETESGPKSEEEGPSKKRRLSPSQQTFHASTAGGALVQRTSTQVTRSRSRCTPDVVTRSQSRASSQGWLDVNQHRQMILVSFSLHPSAYYGCQLLRPMASQRSRNLSKADVIRPGAGQAH